MAAGYSRRADVFLWKCNEIMRVLREPSIPFGDHLIDQQSFRLSQAGKPLAVEPKALHVLIFLGHHQGRLIGRRELLSAVWGDAFLTGHALSRSIGELRKVLGDDANEPRYIETVPTLGYPSLPLSRPRPLEPHQPSITQSRSAASASAISRRHSAGSTAISKITAAGPSSTPRPIRASMRFAAMNVFVPSCAESSFRTDSPLPEHAVSFSPYSLSLSFLLQRPDATVSARVFSAAKAPYG